MVIVKGLEMEKKTQKPWAMSYQLRFEIDGIRD